MDSKPAPNEREANSEPAENESKESSAAEERCLPQGAAPQAADPGCLSNTRGPSSLIEIEGEGYYPLRASGGVDWFEWYAYYHWGASNAITPIIETLQAAKKQCQEERRPFVEVVIPDYGPVRVHRHGFNRGGDRGQHFEFKLDIGGVLLGVSPRDLPLRRTPVACRKYQPNVAFQQRGRDCLLTGALEGYERAQTFLSVLGGRRLRECVSRADLCIDIPELDPRELLALVERRCVITRADSVRPHENLLNGKRTGFSAGKSPLYLTVYDKVQEQVGKSDALYLQALIDRRWGGNLDAKGEVFPTATRVEFQLGRNKLRDLGLDSPTDFLERRGTVVAYLTQEWFRLTNEPIDSKAKHQSRATTHSLWKSIIRAFAEVFGPPEGQLKPLDRAKVEPIQLAAQARGCLLSCLLQRGVEFSNYPEFVQKATNLLYTMFLSPEGRQEFLEEARKRRHGYEAQ